MALIDIDNDEYKEIVILYFNRKIQIFKEFEILKF